MSAVIEHFCEPGIHSGAGMEGDQEVPSADERGEPIETVPLVQSGSVGAAQAVEESKSLENVGHQAVGSIPGVDPNLQDEMPQQVASSVVAPGDAHIAPEDASPEAEEGVSPANVGSMPASSNDVQDSPSSLPDDPASSQGPPHK